MTISIISAIGREREIGIEGKLPWHIPEDLKRFKEITKGHTVIMGRKTFESIGRPLPNRKNIIVTRNPNFLAPSGCIIVRSFEEALNIVKDDQEAFVIGGAEIYSVALPSVKRMYLTQVDYHGPADTYFPDFDLSEWDIVTEQAHQKSESAQYDFKFVVCQRKTD